MNIVYFVSWLSLVIIQIVSSFSRLQIVDRLDTYNTLLKWFDGTFNNIEQSEEDSKNGLDLASGYGHRHVTCHILRLCDDSTPSKKDFLQAIYTLDGDEGKVYRLRIYEFIRPEDSNYNSMTNDKLELLVAKMRIYRPTCMDYKSLSVTELRRQATGNTAPYLLQTYDYLSGCDIGWVTDVCPTSGQSIFVGSILREPCLIQSERDPLVQLRIQERVELSDTRMSVNDRVYDLSGKLLHGDKGGLPYMYKKTIVAAV